LITAAEVSLLLPRMRLTVSAYDLLHTMSAVQAPGGEVFHSQR
jgi:hypothetical protein